MRTGRRGVLWATVASAVVGVTAQSPPVPGPPPWAFTVNTPAPPGGGSPAVVPDPAPRRVPGSDRGFTLAETRDAFSPPDWHPEAHPPMPEAVARGRRPDMRACGYCHLPNGQGRPENASLAGLPATYIIQQMADFRSGARRSSEPRMGPPNAMIADAKAATDEEVHAAADYFASVPYRRWIRVVEAGDVPATRIAGWMHVPTTGTEPLGRRIVEMPEDLARTELRDASSGFQAYVPVGSIRAGEALVRSGGAGRTLACGACHGFDLKGLGPVPPLAGRSPSYTVRQLFDFQQGSRQGTWSPLMKAVVEKLTIDDMIAIAAYTASREP